MTENFQQETNGPMIYPEKGTKNRLLYRIPLIWWRMGLGPLLSHDLLRGSKMLALTTRGRKTGIARHTILTYIKVSSNHYACSGWGTRSDWVRNIQNNPQVTVQIGNKTFSALAYRINNLDEFSAVTQEMFRTGGDSHFKPWLKSFGIEFSPGDMIAKRERLCIYRFDPVEELGLPPLSKDLNWIWIVFLLVLISIVILFK